jgi:hypothetical protein
MKKTVFVTGLFADRHHNFFIQLCHQFEVICFQACGFTASPERPFSTLESFLPPEALNISMEQYFLELHKSLRFIEKELEATFEEGPQSVLQDDEILNFHRLAFQVFTDAHLFRKLLQTKKIDMVLVCSDYDSHKRRNIVIEASKQNIVTINVEHGFLASSPPLDAYDPKKACPLLHASTYGIVDNPIEQANTYNSERRKESRTEYVVLGTPIESAIKKKVDRQLACDTLKIDPEKRYLTYLGTWWCTSHQSFIAKTPLEDAGICREFIKQFADYHKKTGIELIVKFHPTHANSPYFEQVRDCWLQYAEEYNCPIALITRMNLNEVLSVTEMTIMHHTSSVVWDCFMEGIPSICYYGPFLKSQFSNPSLLKDGSELYKNDIIQAVFSFEEIWQSADKILKTNFRSQFDASVMDIKERMGVENVDVLEKSQKVINWMNNLTPQSP